MQPPARRSSDLGTSHNIFEYAAVFSAKAPHCAYPITRRPLLSSTPENSRPTISGGGGVPGYPPFVVITSAKFNPPAPTRTTV